MTDLRQAAQQALEALERYQVKRQDFDRFADEITALRTALEQQQQQNTHWLTKELMADYLDVIAEAVENNNSETLRHKSHWMRTRGYV